MEKFIVMTNYGSYIIEATDFEDAFYKACDNHSVYDDVQAIVRIPEED